MISGMLHNAAAAAKAPVMWLLLMFLLLSAFLLGGLICETALRMRRRIPAEELIKRISEGKASDLKKIIKGAGFGSIRTSALMEMCDYGGLSPQMLAEAAQCILNSMENRYLKRIAFTDFITKIAPMMGLMGTLIPLGPGIMALGRGDMQTLSDSIVTAFDTTVTGLISAGTATLISSVRKIWYKTYIAETESVTEAIMEKLIEEDCKSGETEKKGQA